MQDKSLGLPVTCHACVTKISWMLLVREMWGNYIGSAYVSQIRYN